MRAILCYVTSAYTQAYHMTSSSKFRLCIPIHGFQLAIDPFRGMTTKISLLVSKKSKISLEVWPERVLLLF
jgi:hypothetical protein